MEGSSVEISDTSKSEVRSRLYIQSENKRLAETSIPWGLEETKSSWEHIAGFEIAVSSDSMETALESMAQRHDYKCLEAPHFVRRFAFES